MTPLSLLVTGIALGFTQGCSPGPHSALVISETLKGNSRQGALVAFAPVIATFPILLLTVPFASLFSGYSAGMGLLALIGGSYLLYLAWETMKVSQFNVDSSAKSKSNPFWMGFNAALLSPHPYLFWSTAGATLLISAYQQSIVGAALFLIGFLGVFFLAKLVLVLLASQLRFGTNGKGFVILMKCLAIVLAAFSVTLWIDGLRFLGVIL